MSGMITLAVGGALLLFPLLAVAQASTSAGDKALQWPPITRQTKPWTRWWWPGSAVDKPNLTRLLETYQQAGLGGVEITPIYGIMGQESRELSYLSPSWLDALKHTLAEAHRLDMGVDMPTGTGWPFGGPQVQPDDSLDKLVVQTEHLAGGAASALHIGAAHPQALSAFSKTGKSLFLLDRLDANGNLNWQAPPGDDWTLVFVGVRGSGMKVKRAAPGGAGLCINPFSATSLTHYLMRFDTALASLPKGALRCHFHDSFEYQSNWTPELLDEFKQRRGYDLRDHLLAFAGLDTPDANARVRTDVHETISDLLLQNFTLAWSEWAHRQGSLSRNQAHGSPGNLLDLYGAADIPETEVFRSKGDIRVSKFASSAAHVLGKPLTSSESCTWQSEHFTETLADSKHILDRLLVAGINHVFYHGTAYSPADAAWPGWLFYAATHFEPNNPTWHDFPALNAYVTRCQSVLQSGRPDNDVLLYWPLHDLWQKHPETFGLTIEGKWLESEPFGDTAQQLWDRGYAYDYISDRQLASATATLGGIHLPGGIYQTFLIPPCKFMPLPTLQKLLELVKNGTTIVFQNGLPQDVPGLGDLEKRRSEFHRLLNTVKLPQVGANEIQESAYGKGRILVGSDPASLLEHARIRRESIVDHEGILFTRRYTGKEHYYFVVNQGKKALDGWVTLAVPSHSVVLMNPMTGQTGTAKVRQAGKGKTEAYLQLSPGASLIVRALPSYAATGQEWPYRQTTGEPIPLTGKWQVQFQAGGPNLPAPFATNALGSWTENGDVETQRFGGTAHYTLTFDAPKTQLQAGDTWLLNLGEVHESAAVCLNGHALGTLFAPPFCVPLCALKPTGNVLEVDVTNVAANRIRDMDRRKVAWKIFHEINFVNINYKPFDASDWPIRPSGLLGPVTLTRQIPAGM